MVNVAYLLNRWSLWRLLRLCLTRCDHYGLIVLLTHHTLWMLGTLNACKRNLKTRKQVNYTQSAGLLYKILTCWFPPGDCWISFCCIFCICCGDTFYLKEKILKTIETCSIRLYSKSFKLPDLLQDSELILAAAAVAVVAKTNLLVFRQEFLEYVDSEIGSLQLLDQEMFARWIVFVAE